MTDFAEGRMRRTSRRRSADRRKYSISPAYPRSIHSEKNFSSAKSSAGAMPHASNPSSRAFFLMSVEVMAGGRQRSGLRARSDELPHDIRQDYSVAERHQLLGRVDPRHS